MTVSDLMAAAAFYEQTLELPVRRVGGSVAVTIGSSELILSGGRTGTGSHHLAITVPATQFALAKRWLAERVPLLQRDGADEFALPAPWLSQSVYFFGPDDVLLELIVRHSLGSNASGPFGSQSLIGISEVGIAVTDVEAATSAVHDAYGLTEFDTGGPEFVPVGDHHGLLIVVSRGRTWFPTASRIPSEDALIITLDSGSTSPGTPITLGNCALTSARSSSAKSEEDG